MLKFKLFLFAAVFFYGSNAFSLEGCYQYGCENVYVQEMYLRSDGSHLIQTSGDETKADCIPDSNVFLEINKDSPNKDDIYSAVLASFIAGRKVSFRTVDKSKGCKIGYIRLVR